MIYAYWFIVAALIIAQVLGYVAIPFWVFVVLVGAPFAIWVVMVALVAVLAVYTGR